MAIRYADGTVSYQGAVLDTQVKHWSDGMMSEYAIVWDAEDHQCKLINTGYVGSDCRNLINNITGVEVEVSSETAREVIKVLKQQALQEYCRRVSADRCKVKAGMTAKVIRGRKVPKGTILSVFWTGERPTYTGHDKELIAGCKDKDGNKVWIKAEYLCNLNPPKSPCTKERKQFIKTYIHINANEVIKNSAKGR